MSIPDFTDSEFQLVNQTLLERYGRLVPLQAAEVELLLKPGDTEPSSCPALYWDELGAGFIVAKVGDRTLLTALWSGGVSKNPYLSFKFTGAAKGEKVEITWTDSKGATESETAEIE